MWAICRLSLQRLREPAMLMLGALGILLAWGFSGSNAFEMQEAETREAARLLVENKLLLGTVLLVALGMLTTVFNAASEIPRDIDSRFIAILLTKPLGRLHYLVGKFLAALLMGLILTGTWVTIMLVCRALLHGGESETPLTASVVFAQYACLLILVPVVAAAITVSCWFADVVAMILTSVYVLLGIVAAILPVTACLLPGSARWVIMTLYLSVPNLTYFVQSQDSVTGYALLVVYAFSAAATLLVLGHVRFARKDLF